MTPAQMRSADAAVLAFGLVLYLHTEWVKVGLFMTIWIAAAYIFAVVDTWRSR